MRKYPVYIHKVYFPTELRPTAPGKEDFEQWNITASSRTEAAEKAWELHGKRLLALMGPRLTKLPRKVSLFVGDPSLGSGGLPGRMPPILVYSGE